MQWQMKREQMFTRWEILTNVLGKGSIAKTEQVRSRAGIR